MKTIITIVVVFNIVLTYSWCQVTCDIELRQIHELNDASRLKSGTEPNLVSKKIRQSKKLTKQTLKLAYETLKYKDCKEYSNIVDLIIDLELRLRNFNKAQTIALERLNKTHPNWRNISEKVNISHLTALSRIHKSRKMDSYYKKFRKNNGNFVIGCGWEPYVYKVKVIMETAEILYSEYGKEFCFKYLQQQPIIISEDDIEIIEYWDNIHSLLLQSMTPYYTFEKIKTMYENASIEEIEQNKSYYRGIDIPTSKFYYKLGEINLFFIKHKCDKSGKGILLLDRCEPTNIIELKREAAIFKKIKEYAS
jgi:hypothetical protein